MLFTALQFLGLLLLIVGLTVGFGAAGAIVGAGAACVYVGLAGECS